MTTVGEDGTNLIWSWMTGRFNLIISCIRAHWPTLSDESHEEYDYLRNSGFRFFYLFTIYSLINPFRRKNWMLYIGLTGVSLSVILITLYFGVSLMYSSLVGLCCEILFILFIISDRFKISLDLISSVFFLIVNVILFLMDFYLLYRENPYNTGFPTMAFIWGIMLMVITTYWFSILQVLYGYLMGYTQSKREERRRQLIVVQVGKQEH